MTRPDLREMSAQMPLLASLAQPALESILQSADSHAVSAKAVIFHQGDSPRDLILLVRGIVKVWQTRPGGDPATIHVLVAGDLLGAVPVLRRIPYPATATAATDCMLLSWTLAQVEELMGRYPAIRSNVLDFVGQRNEELVHRLGEMATERVEQRIARCLLRLADQTGRLVPEGIEIGYPLSRQDIAEIAGTDLYSVSRVVRDWAGRGLVAAGRLRIVLRDRHGLAQIAEDTG